MRPPLFEIRGVRKEFPGGIIALDGIDLDIAAGECLLLAGSNGSGKTILMKILTGLLEATQGTIRFQGQPLEAALKNNAAFRRQVGIMFQDADAQFIGETVEEDAAFGPANLGLSKAEIEACAAAALEKMGLAGKRKLPPRTLSGGEKRRLAAAGVLAMGCRTIIMDEPFANLDHIGVLQTLHLIRSLKADGVTVILLTHELEKALAFADRLLILHQGLIREDGPPEATLNRLKPEYGIRDPRCSCKAIQDCSWLV